MAKPLTILHISDLHARRQDESELRIRVKALHEDITALEVKVDMVLFTGDIAYSGNPDEYAAAREWLMDSLSSRLQVSKKSIFIVPGNHDVNRGAIHRLAETGLIAKIGNDDNSNDYVQHEVYSHERQSAFHQFINEFLGYPASAYRTQIVPVNGVRVGIACMNSAWRCSGDEDQGRLFLSQKQVNDVVAELEGCDIRIGLMHHPFDWLSQSEQETVVSDLKQQFDIIATGHLHTPRSRGEISTTGQCILLSCPSICDGMGQVGYSIYTIDYAGGQLKAQYRKFIRERREFDRDIVHARNGEAMFSLPIHALAERNQTILCQHLAQASSNLELQMQSGLANLQRMSPPVYVSPPVRTSSWEEGRRRSAPFRGDLLDITEGFSVVYGPAESGKTILLQAMAAEVNRKAANDRDRRVAVFVDLRGVSTGQAEQRIERAVLETVEREEAKSDDLNVVVFADHVAGVNAGNVTTLRDLHQKKRTWSFVLSTGNELLFDSLLASPPAGDLEIGFYELSYWGPSRIHMLANSYLADAGVDIEAAYKFVCDSLRSTDLPATPVVIVLYLTVFRVAGGQLSSLSFLRVLERFEQIRLAQPIGQESDSLYSQRWILGLLATECARLSTNEVPRTEFQGRVQSHFDKCLLGLDAGTYLEALRESGIINLADDYVGFRYYVFFDYYLARSFHDQTINVEDNTKTLSDFIRLTDSLALYSGLLRERVDVANRLLGLMETCFPSTENFTLAHLDTYIDGLLFGPPGAASADAIATSDMNAEVDYEALDEPYSEDREDYRERREAALGLEPEASDIDEINYLIFGLKAFYNLFRNLEHISGDDKVHLLDQILTYHIRCNIRLIRFYHNLLEDGDFRTLIAYMLTLGGQAFMTANLANQTLVLTIDETIRQCDNDFKALLLLFLYADLRLPGYDTRLEDFVRNTNSVAAIEMIYLKIRVLLIESEERKLPVSLLAAFRAAFDRRVKVNEGRVRKSDLHNQYNRAVESVKKERLIQQFIDSPLPPTK